MDALHGLLTGVWAARATGAAAGAAFALHDRATWSAAHYVAWALVVAGGMEALTQLVSSCGHVVARARRIRAQGKPLADFEPVDRAFQAINKLVTAAFAYHAVAWAATSPLVRWRPADATLANTALALPALFVVYDLPYTLFHRLLHHGAVYGYVHKHHHRQSAPSRGNPDAINVHPLEFVLGEYNHLLAAFLVASALSAATHGRDGLHVATLVVFVLGGGVLASLNHTRFDARVSVLGVPVYSVALHDVHHHAYNYNYAQYVPVWDYLLGTYRPHEEHGGAGGGGRTGAEGAPAARAR